MQLSDLKKPWSKLGRGEKISIIEESQQRRIQAAEQAKKKKSKSRSKKKSKKKKKSKNVKKTPKQLMKLKNSMSTEEWENFKMMTGMDSG